MSFNTEIFRNATPEQHNLWDYASALIAYTTITPLYFQGVIAGSEFLTYAATKLYICLELVASSNGNAWNTNFNIGVYDEGNVLDHYISNSTGHWNVTAAAVNFVSISITNKNFYFSRLVALTYTTMKFIGYRLNV